MYISTTVIISTLSVLRGTFAAPLVSRQVCGAAPTGTTAQTPLFQPSGITTASACAAKCTATTDCQSFLFGLVDGADKCELFSVPASSLPPQTNLVAYDIGCASIPNVVPTTANPGGLAIATPATPESKANAGSGPNKSVRQVPANPQAGTNNNVGTHAAPKNAQPAGNPTPIATPQVSSVDACLASCRGNPECVNYTFVSGVCKIFSAAGGRKTRRQQNTAPAAGSQTGAQPSNTNSGNQNQGGNAATPNNSGNANANGNAQQGTHANPMNAAPAGSPAPIATPGVNDLAACLAACRGNNACIAYTFVSGVCRLFN